MYRSDKYFMKNPATASSRIYVGNLVENLQPDKLEEKFAPYGRILGLVVQRNFGFVQYASEEQAQNAINCEHGSMFLGKKLNVRKSVDNARPKFLNNPQQRNLQPQNPKSNVIPNNLPQQNQNYQSNQQNSHPNQTGNTAGSNADNQQLPANFTNSIQSNQQNFQNITNASSNLNRQSSEEHAPKNNEQTAAPLVPPKPQPSPAAAHQSPTKGPIMSSPSATLNKNPQGNPKQQNQPEFNAGNKPLSENMSDRGEKRRRRGARRIREFYNRDDSKNTQALFGDNFREETIGSNQYPYFNEPMPANYAPDSNFHPKAPTMDAPERNDCEIIVVAKSLTEYAEYIEQRLKDLGLIVDLLFPNDDVPIGRVLGNISSRGCLFAILVMPLNEEHRSLTLNILHGIPEEHRNMPIEDALVLITRNFEAYMRGEAPSDTMTVSSKHPEPIQMIINLLAENRQVGSSSYDKLIKYLQEKRELQSSFEISEGIDTGIEPETKTKQTELQNRILNILNKKEEPEVEEKQDETSSKPILQDPTVQKALDSLFTGEMFKGLTS